MPCGVARCCSVFGVSRLHKPISPTMSHLNPTRRRAGELTTLCDLSESGAMCGRIEPAVGIYTLLLVARRKCAPADKILDESFRRLFPYCDTELALLVSISPPSSGKLYQTTGLRVWIGELAVTGTVVRGHGDRLSWSEALHYILGNLASRTPGALASAHSIRIASSQCELRMAVVPQNAGTDVQTRPLSGMPIQVCRLSATACSPLASTFRGLRRHNAHHNLEPVRQGFVLLRSA
jgi:hypothetical protein